MAFTPVTVLNSSGAATGMGAFQDPSGNNYPATVLDSNRAFYRASAVFTPFATGALQLFNIIGSATKTVRVTRVGVAPTTGTAAASISGYMQIASTAGASGTAVTPTVCKMDQNSAAATAVVTHYTTAAQTAGTAVGILSQFVVGVPIVSVPTVSILNQMQMLFPEVGGGGLGGQAIVLRGTSQWLQVINTTPANFANAVSMSYFIEWCEDAS